MSASELKFDKLIHAPASRVYRAFTNSTYLRQWLADGASTYPQLCGRVIFWWNDGYTSTGEFTILEPDTRVGFTWRGPRDPVSTDVEVQLAPRQEDTLVTVTHRGLPTGPNTDTGRQEFAHGWESGLENLASVLETGKDLRLYNRPMLGITLTDFDETIAARLHIPVSAGMRLDGVIDGMGAKDAGLQQNDVIVRFAGKEVRDFPDLQLALSGKKAGDSVEVEFYRGPLHLTIPMRLSGRPIPSIPASLGDFAAQLAEHNSRQWSELASLFENVSDEEASHRPEPEEWNAKEVIAHLIHEERENQRFFGDSVNAQEPWYDDRSPNLTARNRATVEIYPTIPALLEELKRAHAETVALIRHLPEVYLTNRYSYWTTVDGLLNSGYHIDAHIPQIQQAIASARSLKE